MSLVCTVQSQVCDHCGEEFCHGRCLRFHYEDSKVSLNLVFNINTSILKESQEDYSS